MSEFASFKSSPNPTSRQSIVSSSQATSSSSPIATPTNNSTLIKQEQQRCCDTGRPIFTDPITGQSICSCQYELLGYQRLAAAGSVPGLPALSMYSSPYPEGMAAYFPALSADQAPFYSSTAASLDLKDNLVGGSAATWPYPSVYHPYDTAFAGYPFNGYGMDLNGARRKNATRETTSTLKAWLNEHKKNPYPTKGEKIMLAIITKMTLTQVSTWFANARRRLKKENKMTWEPRNRVDDDDNNNDDDDRKSPDTKDILDSKDSGTASSEDGDRPSNQRLAQDTASEWSESRHDSGPESPDGIYDRAHPSFLPNRAGSSPQNQLSSTTPPSNGKPRIWSLADMASKDIDEQPNNLHAHTAFNQQPFRPTTSQSYPAAMAAAAASSFYNSQAVAAAAAVNNHFLNHSLSSRLPSSANHQHHHHHHQQQHSSPSSNPYSRSDLYRSIYAPAPNSTNTKNEISLLETYSRTFGTTSLQAMANNAAAIISNNNNNISNNKITPATSRTTAQASTTLPSTSETSVTLKPMTLNKA